VGVGVRVEVERESQQDNGGLGVDAGGLEEKSLLRWGRAMIAF